jgi:iron complex transport system ATP-binding protein
MLPAPADVIALRGAGVMRSGKRLIQDVDWDVNRGERWIVFGPNGAGKTTLLEVVSTYSFPAMGTGWIFGQQLGRTDVRALRPRIGYVGPGPLKFVRHEMIALEVVLTGKHASFVDPRFHAYEDSDWQRAHGHLTTMGVDHLAEREFATMSEGEKKRVLIARGLMANPELLLLDEPGTGLDLGAREQLVSSLSGLADGDDQTTVILVTHHLEEIPPGFDRILLIGDGRVVGSGQIEDVLTSELLSRTFGMPIEVDRRGARYSAWSPG